MRTLIWAAIIVASVGPAFSRDAKPRVNGVYACVKAANDRRIAEADLLPRPDKDPRTPQSLAWSLGRDRLQADFRADVRRCMTAGEAASLCMFGELITPFEEDIDQCGLRQALPQGRFWITKTSTAATAILIEAAAMYDLSRNSPCEQGGNEGTNYIEAHKITNLSDKRLCTAMSTWFGPTGTRVQGLLSVTK